MPISGGSYVSPTWTNDASPAINASELQAITDTLAVNGAQTLAAQLYKAINSVSAINYANLASGDYLGVADASATAGKKISVIDLQTYLFNNLGFGLVEVGSYVGTGTYGENNPNTISFSHGGMKYFQMIGAYNAYSGAQGNITYQTFDRNIILLDTLTTTYSSGSTSFLYPFLGTQLSSDPYRMWAKKSGDGTILYWYIKNGSESANPTGQYNRSGATYYWIALG